MGLVRKGDCYKGHADKMLICLYEDSSLVDLYDESFMPADLRKVHRENDKAVMQAYGFNIKMTESECVAELFKLYEKLSK